MSAPEDAMRASFRRQLMFELGVVDELVDLRMSGYEPPLNAAVVEAATQRVHIRWALALVREDRRWMLAWLLGRYLSSVRPASTRDTELE